MLPKFKLLGQQKNYVIQNGSWDQSFNPNFTLPDKVQLKYLKMFPEPCYGGCGCGKNPCGCGKKKQKHSHTKKECKKCGYDPCKCKKKYNCGGCGKCQTCMFDPCPNVIDCYDSEDGYIKISLSTSVTPTMLPVPAQGTQVTLNFTVTNNGNRKYRGNLWIQSSILSSVYPNGIFLAGCEELCCGQSRTYSIPYTIVLADLENPENIIESRAYILISKSRSLYVGSNVTETRLTNGNADVTGSLLFAPPSVATGNPSTATVTFINLASSLTNAAPVNMSMALPSGITPAMISNLVAPLGSTITLDTLQNRILFATPSIVPGGSSAFTFDVTPTVIGVYVFSGLIQTGTYDPNISNNTLVATLTVT